MEDNQQNKNMVHVQARKGNELAESLSNLKKVIPLMGKYSIPVTPAHYAVWYTYVAETNAEVKKRIDNAIENNGICSTLTSSEIYQDCLENKNALSVEKLRQSLEAMVLELSSSFTDTIESTSSFSGMIDGSLGRLSRVAEEGLSLEDTMSLIQKLVHGTENLKKNTQQFTEQLVNTQKEIITLREELGRARNEAIHDALTGLYNRRAFDLEANEVITAKTPFCLVMMDLDHFKQVNDTYGHAFGDSVLKATAKIADSVFSQLGGHVYRVGGEEIIVLLPRTKLSAGIHIADTCRRRIARISIRCVRTNTIVSSIRASFGVAEWNGRETLAEVRERTDAMLYRAKEQGRDRVMPMVI